MKKTFLYLAVIGLTMSISLSSCTKEQKALGNLYGVWNLDSQLDTKGDLIVPASGTSSITLWTFYRCSEKDNDPCTGSRKTTLNYTIAGVPQTDISGSNFNYSVFQNTQLLIGNAYWEIESLTKKELVVHPVQSPKARHTFSKQ
jgi:hypothetical protein